MHKEPTSLKLFTQSHCQILSQENFLFIQVYIMRKTLVALHFNENHSNSTNTFKFREKIIKGVVSR
jgi:hypothetical protein